MVPFLLIVPNMTTDILALVLLVGIYLLQKMKGEKSFARS